jgi:hypothetical protein
VFGVCRLLGIKLMPRMRGLSDAAFYRPTKSVRYAHIDALFTGDADWDLIATHARNMIQVLLSIQAGRVLPSMLLRGLGTYNRHSLLYRAFRKLGRVERTQFLLRYISNTEVRRIIRAETTNIEIYNDFLDWVSFGGPVIKSGVSVEQEKQLKYASLVANTIMLPNVADMTKVLSNMAAEGRAVTPALVARTNPYLRGHILRFGQHALDMATCCHRWILNRFRSKQPEQDHLPRTRRKPSTPVNHLVDDFRAYPQPTSDVANSRLSATTGKRRRTSMFAATSLIRASAPMRRLPSGNASIRAKSGSPLMSSRRSGSVARSLIRPRRFVPPAIMASCASLA